ncbi:MAG: hypothetical protein ING91_19315 [Rhodocyclaceae bacterium]|nr:hypothetical protein [Rhodocyclaceae bacterium]MCA3116384.1 hypothetical protein [Rhodocyclaceae bacterium]
MSDTTVRPALETLRELDQGNLLDKLALAIHEATGAALHFEKAARVTLTLDVKLLTQKHLSEPAITVEATVETKLPKRDPYQALFFIDENGNPTVTQQRQRDLGLSIATTNQNEEVRKHG